MMPVLFTSVKRKASPGGDRSLDCGDIISIISSPLFRLGAGLEAAPLPLDFLDVAGVAGFGLRASTVAWPPPA
jgi:hypothetical protein